MVWFLFGLYLQAQEQQLPAFKTPPQQALKHFMMVWETKETPWMLNSPNTFGSLSRIDSGAVRVRSPSIQSETDYRTKRDFTSCVLETLETTNLASTFLKNSKRFQLNTISVNFLSLFLAILYFAILLWGENIVLPYSYFTVISIKSYLSSKQAYIFHNPIILLMRTTFIIFSSSLKSIVRTNTSISWGYLLCFIFVKCPDIHEVLSHIILLKALVITTLWDRHHYLHCTDEDTKIQSFSHRTKPTCYSTSLAPNPVVFALRHGRLIQVSWALE